MSRPIPTFPIAPEEYSRDSEQKFRRDLEQSVFSIQQRLDSVESIETDASAKASLIRSFLFFRATESGVVTVTP